VAVVMVAVIEVAVSLVWVTAVAVVIVAVIELAVWLVCVT